jgi:hypothetical protein
MDVLRSPPRGRGAPFGPIGDRLACRLASHPSGIPPGSRSICGKPAIPPAGGTPTRSEQGQTRRGKSPVPAAIRRPLIGQPFLLGMLLAAGFETASQFAALILTNRLNPWIVGAAFTTGMVVVDGLDGYLAASTQRLAITGSRNAAWASRVLGVLVVVFSFGLGGAELLGHDIDRFALPTGLALFAAVVAIRVWARRDVRTTAVEMSM